MPALTINISNSVLHTFSLSESDTKSGLALLKVSKQVIPDPDITGNELYLTVEQLDLLGRFFIREAKEISRIQGMRRT